MRASLKALCLAVVLVCLLAPAVTWAQGTPTSKASGLVAGSDGFGLPGVTVTLESPNLQGTRVVTTGPNGAYASPPVPPGEYTITFELEGFQTLQQKVRLSAGQNVKVDATLPLATVSEEIVVSGEATNTISDDSTAANTMTFDTMDQLPVARTLQSAVTLAPGVTTNGPGRGDAISISGAQSWENLFTLNGAVINENLRGQPFDLFIEDAIQETTTQVGGISAEYGRFTGGVVNAITKSGGNQFSGSFRTSFDNDSWQSDNEFSPERDDTTNETYEATLGGYFWKDRLWFFGAGRNRDTSGNATTAITNIAYPTTNTEDRYEAKLTASVTPSHQIQGSYLEIKEDQTNVMNGGCCDGVSTTDGSLDDVRSLPQDFYNLNYTGIFTPNMYGEAYYGKRHFTFEGSGGKDRALDTGTPIYDLANGVAFNESLFCDGTAIPECTDEERNNKQGRAKLSYFLSTESAGSHDLALGYETFTDIRASDNHQSPNDLMVWTFNATEFVNGQPMPVLTNDGAVLIEHLPILNPTKGTDFKTDSGFINDRWRLSERWSFNVGVRYDTTNAVNSNGAKVADSSAVSPRLGLTYDLTGDGRNVLHGSAGRYVGAAANSIFDTSSPAGNPAEFEYYYLGPTTGVFDPVTYNQIIFDWFQSVCPNAINFSDPFAPPPSSPQDCPAFSYADIPGGTTILDNGLATTSADEITFGYEHQFGTRGRARLDLVHRDYGDFFATRRDLSTGGVVDANGNVADLGVVVNNDSALERKYDGASVSFAFNLLQNNRLRVGGNATVGRARGNFDGETGGSGPVTSGVLEYPEYKQARWNSPKGDLGVDQAYVGRVWALFDVFHNDRNLVNVSLLQNFAAGSPYEAVHAIDPRPYVSNPGYQTPPSQVDYFFSDRGAYTTDSITRTDLALNYSLTFGDFEVFFQPSMTNVFNEKGVIAVNTATNLLAPFNPFTDTPVEGVNWEKGPNFGKPTSEGDLQAPRTWRFSVGFRWNP